MRGSLWRLAASLLVAQALAVPVTEARGGFSGGGGARTAAMGRPVGTLNSYQTANRDFSRGGGGWWGGGSGLGYGGGLGGYGYGGLGGYGYGGWGGDTNSSYYLSPAQTSLPAVAADDPVDVEEKMANRVPHTDGPSMSFESSDPVSTTDTFSQFNRDWDQIAGPVTYTPYPPSTRVSADLKLPSISRRLPSLGKSAPGSSVTFNSGGAGFTSQVQSKLTATQQLINEYKDSGRLGTFDVASLQKRFDLIQSQFMSTSDPGAQTQMLTDLAKLDYDIRQHSGN